MRAEEESQRKQELCACDLREHLTQLCMAKLDDIPRWDRKRFRSPHPLRNYGWLPGEDTQLSFRVWLLGG